MSAVDSDGRTTFVANAHRDDGKHFFVRANEKLTAFLELESAFACQERPYMRIRHYLTRQRYAVFFKK